MAVKLNGVQKIAVLLTAIGEEAATALLKRFDEPEQERIGQALVELEDTDLVDADVEGILEEFRELTRSGGVFRSHLARTLSIAFERLHGPEQGVERVAKIREASRSRAPFLALRGLRADDLSKIITSEHPQVQAIIIANLDTEQAAEILSALPEDERATVVSRMATMKDAPPRLLKQVAQQLIDRTRDLPREEASEESPEVARLGVVADILNATDAGVDKEILKQVEESDEELSRRIRERLFTWNDLTLVDKRTMQKILAGIDTKILALSLKSCDAEVADALLAATSQRTKDMVMEERELLGAVAMTEVQEAQRQILATVRELMDSGEISVSKGKGQSYVE